MSCKDPDDGKSTIADAQERGDSNAVDMERVSVMAFPASVRVTWLIRPHSNEVNVVMIAACIPTLRPLFLVIFNRPGGTPYRKRPYHDSSSEQNPDSHARTKFDYQAADDPPSDIAQQEFVAVSYRTQELVLEPSHEGEDIDAHESWLEVESTRSIAPKRKRQH